MVDIASIVSNGEEHRTRWHVLPSTEGSEKPARVQIRTLKPGEMKELGRKCLIRKMRRGQYTERIDNVRMSDLLLDKCIVGWENIEMDGTALEVNLKNKKLLDDNWAEFNALWNAVIGSDEEVDLAIAEAESGN